MQFSNIGRIEGAVSLKRRSISCFAIGRVGWRVLDKKVGTDDSTWVVAIVNIVFDSGSLDSVRCRNWVGGEDGFVGRFGRG